MSHGRLWIEMSHTHSHTHTTHLHTHTRHCIRFFTSARSCQRGYPVVP